MSDRAVTRNNPLTTWNNKSCNSGKARHYVFAAISLGSLPFAHVFATHSERLRERYDKPSCLSKRLANVACELMVRKMCCKEDKSWELVLSLGHDGFSNPLYAIQMTNRPAYPNGGRASQSIADLSVLLFERLVSGCFRLGMRSRLGFGRE